MILSCWQKTDGGNDYVNRCCCKNIGTANDTQLSSMIRSCWFFKFDWQRFRSWSWGRSVRRLLDGHTELATLTELSALFALSRWLNLITDWTRMIFGAGSRYRRPTQTLSSGWTRKKSKIWAKAQTFFSFVFVFVGLLEPFYPPSISGYRHKNAKISQ